MIIAIQGPKTLGGLLHTPPLREFKYHRSGNFHQMLTCRRRKLNVRKLFDSEQLMYGRMHTCVNTVFQVASYMYTGFHLKRHIANYFQVKLVTASNTAQCLNFTCMN